MISKHGTKQIQSIPKHKPAKSCDLTLAQALKYFLCLSSSHNIVGSSMIVSRTHAHQECSKASPQPAQLQEVCIAAFLPKSHQKLAVAGRRPTSITVKTDIFSAGGD